MEQRVAIHKKPQKLKPIRVRRGRYLTRGNDDRFSVACALADGCHLGYRTALEYHGLAEPSDVLYVCSPRRVRPCFREGLTYRHVSGFSDRLLLERNGVRVPSLSRLFVDVIDRPSLSGDLGDILIKMGGRINFDEVSEYLDSLGNKSLCKKVGYYAWLYCDYLEPPLEFLDQCRERGKDVCVRIPGEDGRFNSLWNIVAPRIPVPAPEFSMPVCQEAKRMLVDMLNEKKAMWSQGNEADEKSTPDEEVIEKCLLHLEFEDMGFLFMVYPEDRIRYVFRHSLLRQNYYYEVINWLLAVVVFNMENANKYIEYYSRLPKTFL